MKESEILKQYLPWIYKHANKYSQLNNHYLEQEDLVSVGSWAVFDAIERYDPNNKHGAKLDTYVMNHIRHRMQTAMREAGMHNSSQQNAMIMLSSWLKVIGEDATAEEIAAYSQQRYAKSSTYHWTLAQVKSYLSLWRTKTYALDLPIDPSDPQSIVKNVAVADVDIEEEYGVLEEKQLLYNEINKLKPQYKHVMIGRIVKEQTLEEIGDELCLTRERIRQIEQIATKIVSKAIQRKMKNPIKKSTCGPKPKKRTKYEPPKPKPPVVIPKEVVKKIMIPEVPKVQRKPEFKNVKIEEVRLPIGTKVSTKLGTNFVISEDLGYQYEAFDPNIEKYILLRDNEIIDIL